MTTISPPMCKPRIARTLASFKKQPPIKWPHHSHRQCPGHALPCLHSQLLSRLQPSVWPTTAQSPTADPFDPFASLESPGFSANLFPSTSTQSFSRPAMFQQPIVQTPWNAATATQPSRVSSVDECIRSRLFLHRLQNTWSSAQGKVDISLNNLIPHTRGEPPKNSMPLNQITSPTSPIDSAFSSFSMNGPSIFATSNQTHKN